MNDYILIDKFWRKACEAEGANPALLAVHFSPSNNYARIWAALVLDVVRRGPVN